MFTGDSLLIGDVGRPDLHVAGDAARPGAPPARVARSGCSSCPTTSSSTRATTRGSVCGRGLSGNPFSLDRLRARAQPAARSTPIRTRSPRRCSPTCRRRPLEQERIVAANRARQALGAPHERAGPARAARERARSSRCSSASTRSSARWSGSSAACCRSSASRTSASRSTAAILSFVVAFGARQGAHEPRRRRARRAGRPQAAAGRSAGWSRCRCRC